MELSEKAVGFLESSIDKGKATPGQSLTNSKEQPYDWEKPPVITEPKEAVFTVFNSLIEPENAANTLMAINKGVGVLDIASVMLYTGFIEGQWNPDVMLLLLEPTMFMIMALAEKADIEYVIESGDSFVDDISFEKETNIERMQKDISAFENFKKQSVSKISSSVIPKEILEKVESVELDKSLLQRLDTAKEENNNNNSLLSKGVKNEL